MQPPSLHSALGALGGSDLLETFRKPSGSFRGNLVTEFHGGRKSARSIRVVTAAVLVVVTAAVPAFAPSY